jgi:hypothetical protein
MQGFETALLACILGHLMLGLVALVRAERKDIPEVVRELANWWGRGAWPARADEMSSAPRKNDDSRTPSCAASRHAKMPPKRLRRKYGTPNRIHLSRPNIHQV